MWTIKGVNSKQALTTNQIDHFTENGTILNIVVLTNILYKKGEITI